MHTISHGTSLIRPFSPRKVLLLAILALPLALGLPRPAGATSPVTGSGTITATLIDNSALPAGASGNLLFTETLQDTVTGAMSGALVENLTGVYRPSAGVLASFHGIDTCTCTVADATGALQQGTLTLQFEGMEAPDGSLSGQFVIVGGTDGLANLEGQGTFQGSAQSVTYTMALHFDP